jgi:hypothetical protein
VVFGWAPRAVGAERVQFRLNQIPRGVAVGRYEQSGGFLEIVGGQ